MEFGRALTFGIAIRSSANMGYIVEVGCETFVFNDSNDLIKALEKYLKDPQKMEKEVSKILNTVPTPDAERPDMAEDSEPNRLERQERPQTAR